MRYEDKVAEARRLVSDIDTVEPKQWRLAELCYQTVDVDGVKPGKWAADIGKAVDTVWQYRAVYRQNPDRGHGRDLSFLDCWKLVKAAPDQQAALQHVAAKHGVGIGRADDVYRDEVRQVRESLRDPEVAARVVADPDARRAVTRAAFDRDEQTRQTAAERVPQIREVEQERRVADVFSVFTDYRAGLHRVARALENDELTEEQKQVLREECDRAVNATRMFMGTIDTGNIDAELRALLEAGS